jgi:catechol 2,3-dioxygenase-like lactoylglutathione lyase family enzyme
MPIDLNHTIVWCRDNQASATFLTGLLGRPPATAFGPFMVVELDNRLSMDFHATDDPITQQHYAFLISEDDFDAIYGRIVEHGLEHWADPGCREAGVNRNDGGRGTYFQDLDGHLLEVITRPYGGGSTS